MKNNIRQLRLNNGWTQQELSKRTKMIDPLGKGIARSTISDLEAYHVTIRGRNLKLLIKVFEINEDEII